MTVIVVLHLTIDWHHSEWLGTVYCTTMTTCTTVLIRLIQTTTTTMTVRSMSTIHSTVQELSLPYHHTILCYSNYHHDYNRTDPTGTGYHYDYDPVWPLSAGTMKTLSPDAPVQNNYIEYGA